jgi:NADH dehydrogenase [ubiquinone] 1 alpha subcomplex assembly factor 2
MRTGRDLQGNTFWTFKDQINQARWRRMVKGRGGASLSSLSDMQISPQWHQWLRYTRNDPPTLEEQAADVQRQAQLKINAQLADARWAAKARYIEKPKPSLSSQELVAGHTRPDGAKSAQSQHANRTEAAQNPGSTWKPEVWNPGPTKR